MADTQKRKVWFITRPERDPAFHKEALEALWEATDKFAVKWAGNREAHKRYEQVLNQKGLKRDSISNDGSGGRTWAALIRTFNYCYLNDDGYLILNKVGDKILKGEKVKENITKQILTLQIPNAYFLHPRFQPKYEDDFQIQPVRFLIRLCSFPELGYYLTKEEIAYFVMTAKREREIKKTVEMIVHYRNASAAEQNKIKQQIAEEYDHRERSDAGARNYSSAHSDTAHTFMLIAEYTGLVEYIRGNSIRIPSDKLEFVKQQLNMYDQRYPFNKRYLISRERMAQNNGLDVDSYKANDYKDIKPANNELKTMAKANELLKNLPDLSSCTVDDIQGFLIAELSPRQAYKVAVQLHQTQLNSLNEDFITAYLEEENNLRFEDRTGEIFRALGFDVVMRPQPCYTASTRIEILLKYKNQTCGIIDSKNYKDTFALSTSTASLMATDYIPNYDGYDECQLIFFGYIAANNVAGVKNLKKITKMAVDIIHREVPGFIMNAETLLAYLDYCIENDIPLEKRAELFVSLIDGSVYDNFHLVQKRISLS